VHAGAFERARSSLLGNLVRKYPEESRREALRATGLHLTGWASWASSPFVHAGVRRHNSELTRLGML
jgi:hypothetical protein